MCCRVRLSLYFFAKPKSIRNNWWGRKKTWEEQGLIWRQGDDKDNFQAAAVLNIHRLGWKTHRCWDDDGQNLLAFTFQWLNMVWFDIVLRQKSLDPSFISSHGEWNFFSTMTKNILTQEDPRLLILRGRIQCIGASVSATLVMVWFIAADDWHTALLLQWCECG